MHEICIVLLKCALDKVHYISVCFKRIILWDTEVSMLVIHPLQSILRMWSVDNLQLPKEWFLIYFLTSYFHRAQISLGWSGPICCIALILILFDCIFSQLSLAKS